jgi:hypothetical protein
MDSDDEDEDEDRRPYIKEEDDEKDISRTFLTAEEVLEESKLSDELRKTKVSAYQCSIYPISILITAQLKRAHSAEPVNAQSPREQELKNSPATSTTPTSTEAPVNIFTSQPNGTKAESSLMPPPANAPSALPDLGAEGAIGSPFKKQRSSLPGGFDSDVRRKLGLENVINGPRRESESAIASTASALADSVGTSAAPEIKFEPGPALKPNEVMEDEEL